MQWQNQSLLNISSQVNEEVGNFQEPNYLNKGTTQRTQDIEMDSSGTRCLELQFKKKLAPAVLTGQEIKAEEDTPIELVLVDSHTKEVVDFEPVASLKVEICALKEGFGDCQGPNWTREQFNENVVREREDLPVKHEENSKRKRKKHLLGGNTCLNLKRGKCSVENIKFSQYSTWMKKRKFKLGARIPCALHGTRIKEAVSDEFTVEDRRNKLYRKHHPPSLNDQVWRLENIGKGGSFHKRLSSENVNCVKDFLKLHYLDPTRLRNILGNLSAKMWDATVSHALTCELDKKLYLFRSSGSQQEKEVVFNVVGQTMGFAYNGQLISTEKLSASDNVEALDLVLSAFEQWDKVVSFDDEASLLRALHCSPTSGYSMNPPVVANFGGNRSSTIIEYSNGNNPELNSSSIAQMEGCSSVDDEASLMQVLHCLPPADYFSNPPVMAKFDGNKSLTADTCSNGDCPELSSSSTAQLKDCFSSDDYSSRNNLIFRIDQPLSNLTLDMDSQAQVLFEDETLQNFNPDYSLQLGSLRSLNEPQSTLSDVPEHPVPPYKGSTRWKMVFSAGRWIFLRRILAARSCFTNKR